MEPIEDLIEDLDSENRETAMKAFEKIVEEKNPRMFVPLITSQIYQHTQYIEKHFSDTEILEGIGVYLKECCEKKKLTEKWFILKQYYGNKYMYRAYLNEAIITELYVGNIETKIFILNFLLDGSYFFDDLNPLLVLLKNPDERIRIMTLMLLEKIADQWMFTTTVVWEISEMLLDKNQEVRNQALETLCTICREYNEEKEGAYALRFILKTSRNKRSDLREKAFNCIDQVPINEARIIRQERKLKEFKKQVNENPKEILDKFLDNLEKRIGGIILIEFFQEIDLHRVFPNIIARISGDNSKESTKEELTTFSKFFCELIRLRNQTSSRLKTTAEDIIISLSSAINPDESIEVNLIKIIDYLKSMDFDIKEIEKQLQWYKQNSNN